MRGGFVVTGAARSAWTEGGLFWKRVAPVGRSLGQFSRLLLLFRQALAAEEVEVVVPRRRRVDIAGEVVGHRGLGPARVDRGRVVAKMIEVRLVEPVALVGKRAERHVQERVDEKPPNHGAVGMPAGPAGGPGALRTARDRGPPA